MRRVVLGITIGAGIIAGLVAAGTRYEPTVALAPECTGLPNSTQLAHYLGAAPDSGGEAGGLFHGRREWAAVVNRAGEICALAVATSPPSAAWPGRQAIAKAKANTANGFSMDTLPLSTARLYTLTMPGHSLWTLGNANPFNPDCLVSPANAASTIGRTCGGAIAFGGGVPLYANGKVIGGLGTSGDTSCTDHEIAKRIRNLAGLDPAGGPLADDIIYSRVDGPSIYAHPMCPNTWRNGQKIGEETPVQATELL
jgi:uncharacterized protein GlcG (DUF336 family)